MVSAPWIEHSQDTPVIAENLADLDADFCENAGHRDPFTLDLVKSWHIRMHRGCVHIPCPEYVGGFRGEPAGDLEHYDPVSFGRFRAATADTVPWFVEALANRFQGLLAAWDSAIVTPADATLEKIDQVLDQLADIYASWLRIHPFADGNGRSARLLVNWVMTRYWQPPLFIGRPLTDAHALHSATAPAIPASSADTRFLALHLKARLRAARTDAVVRDTRDAEPEAAPSD